MDAQGQIMKLTKKLEKNDKLYVEKFYNHIVNVHVCINLQDYTTYNFM